MNKLLLLFQCLFICAIYVRPVESEAKNVAANLHAKWKSTSLFLEAAEFFAEESPSKFWSFIEIISTEGSKPLDKNCREAMLDRVLAENLLSEGMSKMLSLSLSMRQYSPKVEMFRTLAAQSQPTDSCCWASVGDRVIEDPLALKNLISSSSSSFADLHQQTQAAEKSLNSLPLEFDHVYPTSVTATTDEGMVDVIVYGAPSLPCFTEFHSTMLQLTKTNPKLRYVVRLVTPSSSSSSSSCAALAETTCLGLGGPQAGALPLSGYGVKLDIKNMEYKAQNDEEVKAAQRDDDGLEGSEESAGSEEDVRGFLFKRLAERRPELNAELETFRDHLLSNAAQEETLKVWDLKDLGLQASQRIASSSTPLLLLQDISQNFPSLASSLSRMQINSTVRAEITANQKNIASGTSQLYLNGAPLDFGSMDPLSILGRVRTEIRMADELSSLGLTSQSVRNLLRLKEPSKRVRVDTRVKQDEVSSEWASVAETSSDVGLQSSSSGPVIWLNDLEKDAVYSKYSSSVKELLRPRYPGRLPYLRKNMLNALFVVDPASDSGLQVAEMLTSYLQNYVPVRLGVLVVSRHVLTSLGVKHKRASSESLMEEEEGERSGDEEVESAELLAKEASEEEAELDALSHRVTKMFYAMMERHGASAALDFLRACSENRPQGAGGGMDAFMMQMMMAGGGGMAMPREDLTLEIARGQWRETFKKWTRQKSGTRLSKKEVADEYKALMAKDSQSHVATLAAAKFAFAKGLTDLPLLLVNGEIYTEEDSYGQGIEAVLQPALGKEIQWLAGQVYLGKIEDSTDVTSHLMEEAGYPRFNPLLLPHGRQVPQFRFLTSQEGHLTPYTGLASRLPYLHPVDKMDETKQVSIWIAADPASPSGRLLMQQGALRLLEPDCQARIALLINPATSANTSSSSSSSASCSANHKSTSPSSTCSSKEADASTDSPPAPPLSFLSRLVSAVVQLPTRRHKLPVFLSKALAPADHGGVPANIQELKAAIKWRKHLEAVSAGEVEEEEVVEDPVEEDLNEARLWEVQMEIVRSIAQDSGLQVARLEAVLSDVQGQVAAEVAVESGLIHEWMGVEAGEAALVTNGRLLRVPHPGPTLLKEDLALAELMERRSRSSDVSEVVLTTPRANFPLLIKSEEEEEEEQGKQQQEVEGSQHTQHLHHLTDEAFFSDVILAASLQVAKHQAEIAKEAGVRASEESPSEFLKGKHSGVKVEPDNTTMAVVELEVVLDPLSEAAQKLTPVLILLIQRLPLSLTLFLNPKRDLSDLPLKNYYRYVLPTGDSRDLEPVAVFARMPGNKVLTLGMEVAEAWLVEVTQAEYDLDNIKLDDLSKDTTTLHAAFELEALLVTGHCSELRARQPPRGVQLSLAPALQQQQQQQRTTGTIVMSNLGYFQLQASQPGMWNLKLTPGSSSALYSIHSLKDLTSQSSPSSSPSPSADTLQLLDASRQSAQVAVMDFGGEKLRLQLARRPGMEGLDVLEYKSSEGQDSLGGSKSESDSSSIWNRAMNIFGKASDAEEAQIHIFSVASGHLYERLLKIMIKSVLSHTKSPVKFWFIKNYLSPGFKQVLPRMAEEWSFQFELVTYKWPSWLNKQTEKQRIIWAYKILFLDKLFPLDLQKVIFVDADQIVRTDMKELMDMDLKGRALAYTPFCDNNKEMEGFRFWKQGFWRDHLRGAPYHISALYVVDLARFRQTASGDQLRVVYDNLSRDPNSLANLDQDLPNYAQHQVPIFSLPQEWLWCESWCGNSTKSKAKTIDLCNNPMTKEPKLDMARRIVPEWITYDQQVHQLMDSNATGVPKVDDGKATKPDPEL